MDKKMIEFNKNSRGSRKLDFQAGDVVKIHLKIKESGKERVQLFEGIVIGVKGRQSSSPTITVRKISHGVGVEMILPILSKNVQKIELIKKAKVRRAKLYYIRDLTAKKSRMKYKEIKDFIKEEVAVPEEAKEEKKEEIEKEEKK
ncbi:MAG TPA: 50S ribosomal protein L19 [Candidatus Moranbacteria bacterium]|nr:50S ribosomal protein L19 [Candidatus Moranbacteria bacterium]